MRMSGRHLRYDFTKEERLPVKDVRKMDPFAMQCLALQQSGQSQNNVGETCKHFCPTVNGILYTVLSFSRGLKVVVQTTYLSSFAP